MKKQGEKRKGEEGRSLTRTFNEAMMRPVCLVSKMIMKVSCMCLIQPLGQDRCKQPFLLIYTGAVAAVRGAFALADGIMCIINAATAEIPQERFSTCNRVLSSPGCRAMCMALEAVEVDLQTTTGRWLQ